MPYTEHPVILPTARGSARAAPLHGAGSQAPVMNEPVDAGCGGSPSSRHSGLPAPSLIVGAQLRSVDSGYLVPRESLLFFWEPPDHSFSLSSWVPPGFPSSSVSLGWALTSSPSHSIRSPGQPCPSHRAHRHLCMETPTLYLSVAPS